MHFFLLPLWLCCDAGFVGSILAGIVWIDFTVVLSDRASSPVCGLLVRES